MAALMRAAHDLHGIHDVTPFPRLVGLAAPLAGLGLLRGLRDRSKAVLFQHLPGNGMDLDLGHHGRSPA
jgi:hypothetical protein